jgi:hypothetical protein
VRIYLTNYPPQTTWWAIAPQVPSAASEDAPSRDEALARCRRLVAEERDALTRLGASLEVDDAEELIDWSGPWFLIPDWLVPVRPSLLAAVVRRMDEIADEVERFLDGLGRTDWDRRPPSEWSIRIVLDHIAGGFDIGLRRLEPWPLDPDEAQATALGELRSRLEALAGQRFVTEQSGMNVENGRVRWTPRKVLRVVRALQDAWLAHIAGDGPVPTVPLGHEDRDGDDEPLAPADLEALDQRDRELLDAARGAGHAAGPRSARSIAMSYRYYRDRLTPWPADARERWRAMREAFRRRLLALSETELSAVHLTPHGMCVTARQNLALGIAHVREHLDQMRKLKEVATDQLVRAADTM